MEGAAAAPTPASCKTDPREAPSGSLMTRGAPSTGGKAEPFGATRASLLGCL